MLSCIPRLIARHVISHDILCVSSDISQGISRIAGCIVRIPRYIVRYHALHCSSRDTHDIPWGTKCVMVPRYATYATILRDIHYLGYIGGGYIEIWDTPSIASRETFLRSFFKLESLDHDDDDDDDSP